MAAASYPSASAGLATPPMPDVSTNCPLSRDEGYTRRKEHRKLGFSPCSTRHSFRGVGKSFACKERVMDMVCGASLPARSRYGAPRTSGVTAQAALSHGAAWPSVPPRDLPLCGFPGEETI